MKKIHLLLLVLSIVVTSSCQKEQEQYQQINLKREYTLDGKKLILTYNLTKEGRVAVMEKTEDNLAIYKFIQENPNMFVNYNMQTWKGELYKSIEDFEATRKPLTSKQVEETNKLKSAKIGINFYAYHHPNYNTLLYTSGINHISIYTGWDNTELATKYIGTGFIGADKKGFAVNSLGGGNNKITSFQILQNLSSASHPANYFQIYAYENTSYNYVGYQLTKVGKGCGFYTDGNTAQNGCDDLRKWGFSYFMWFQLSSWDDEIESISGFYRN
jgi:hypothetical protein